LEKQARTTARRDPLRGRAAKNRTQEVAFKTGSPGSFRPEREKENNSWWEKALFRGRNPGSEARGGSLKHRPEDKSTVRTEVGQKNVNRRGVTGRKKVAKSNIPGKTGEGSKTWVGRG